MKIIFAFLICLIAATSIAQTSKYHLDCKSYSSPSCFSYNEMIDANDKTLITSLDTSASALVCFREGEDVFFAIFVAKPLSFVIKNSKTDSQFSEGFIKYSRFKQGVGDDTQMFFGKWERHSSHTDSDLDFEADPNPTRVASITESEITLSYDWKNLKGSTTSYTAQIRNSTLRLNETMQWKGNPLAKIPEDREPGNIEYSGHCARLK